MDFAFISTNLGDMLDATDRLMSTNQSHKYSRINGHLKGGPWDTRRRINRRSGVLPAAIVGRRPPRELEPAEPNFWSLSLTTARQDRNQTLSFLGGEPGYLRIESKKSCEYHGRPAHTERLLQM
jgi:hypothetical protein